MEESKALNFISGIVGKVVDVILKDGTIYQGKLKAFDIHTNIVLENYEEINQEKRRKLNEVFIVGRNLESCWLVEKK
jgi:small nuclear ribonucleoprotein (snRNP)-like protein